MESKSKIFQPKVIIGSITSFIVAAVGIIAVFFPSVFNLEKSSMGEGQFLLSDDKKTHKKLWEFLGENQGKVVQLEIAYCADFEKTTFVATNEKTGRESQVFEFNAIDFMPKWFLGLGGKNDYQSYGVAENLEKFAKQYKFALKYYEWLGKPKKFDESYFGVNTTRDFERHYVSEGYGSAIQISKKTYEVDYVERPPVIVGKIASFHTFHYGNDIYPNVAGANIENGGIGFAFEEAGELKSKDILISHPSNKNKKYIWVVGFENVVSKYLDKTSSLAKQAQKTCKTKQIKPSDIGEDEVGKEDLLKGWGGLPLGYIKGTFYIHEKEELADELGLWMRVSYELESEDYSREKFELEPFDKKDIELRKY